MRTMNRFRSAGVLLLIAATVGGCATINYNAGAVAGSVSMNRPAGNYEMVGSFQTSQRAVFVIASLITVVDANLEEALRREMSRAGGDAVINLRITEQYDIIDFAIGAAQSILLFGAQIVNTRAITLRGDVVRFAGGGAEAALGEELLEHCRAVDLDTTDGARTGHICVQPGGRVALE
jgi:hypothetical protein